MSRKVPGLGSHIKNSRIESLQLSFELEYFTKGMDNIKKIKSEHVKHMLFELLGRSDRFCKSVMKKSGDAEGILRNFC